MARRRRFGIIGRTMRWTIRVSICALTVMAAGLRYRGLFANSFHADEALFATWARLIAVWRDPLLLTQAVDKPPLLFYTQAIFYPLLGTPAAWIARLPNLIASLLLVPLTGRFTWQLYRDEGTILWAAALVAGSPLAIQFSATAFTDPLLTFWLLASLTHMAGSPAGSPSRNTPVRAGLVYGLALAAKYQAGLFLPLVLGLGWLQCWDRKAWQRWLRGFLPILLLIVSWDVIRTGRASLFTAQLTNFGGVRPAWSWELASRLLAWGDTWQTAWGSAALAWGLALGVVLLFLLRTVSPEHENQNRLVTLDQLLILFVLAYLILHWLIAVPIWDRYLLPIIPLTAILGGRLLRNLLVLIQPRVNTRTVSLATTLLLLLWLVPAGLQARRGHFPLGSQPTADSGAAEVATFLHDSPDGTVLYDHWYSWQWRYYFFDRPVFVSWFPHPAGLVADLETFAAAEDARYLALPNDETARPVSRSVQVAGFTLQPVFEASDMTLFRVVK